MPDISVEEMLMESQKRIPDATGTYKNCWFFDRKILLKSKPGMGYLNMDKKAQVDYNAAYKSGLPIAKLESFDNVFEIPELIGCTYLVYERLFGKPAHNFEYDETTNNRISKNYGEEMKKLAQIPQEMYNKLVEDFLKLTKYNFCFDSLGNNLLYNETNYRFEFLDFVHSSSIKNRFESEESFRYHIKDIAQRLFCALFNQSQHNEAVLSDNELVMTKCILALQYLGLGKDEIFNILRESFSDDVLVWAIDLANKSFESNITEKKITTV